MKATASVTARVVSIDTGDMTDRQVECGISDVETLFGYLSDRLLRGVCHF